MLLLWHLCLSEAIHSSTLQIHKQGQKLVHLNDKKIQAKHRWPYHTTPRRMQEFIHQPLHMWIALNRRASSWRQNSAVYLHLKETGHSYEDSCPVLTREDRWWRGVSKKPSMPSWKKLRHYLSTICNAIIYCLRPQLSHLYPGSCDLSHCDPAV